MGTGTPRALRPIAEQVLNDLRHRVLPEDVHRRIELCALAVIEWSMFLDLYELPDPTPIGGGPDGTQ